MTLSELLVELKAVDPETVDDIGDIVNVISILSDGSFILDAYYPDFIIQGCIQRACERRGWTWVVFKQTPDNEKSHCGEIGEVAPGYDREITMSNHEYCTASVEMDSAAEALLAAYVAAVKEEKR
ncbi:MAG: hypothetical protein WC343_13990 [Bacilli bacterium]|jgi:hypothetical protein